MKHRVWTWIEDYYSKIGGKDMEKSALEITEEQKQQLMATTLTNGTNAWEFVQSRPQDAQPWVAKGILSCLENGYRLDLLMIGWETRDLRQKSKI